ncbi:MAG TPA: spore coat protein [Candidatus Onthousia excrementipullorum]|uniref:Spore coat protein n=1 Tax=Candidatus Onthousia excrementipullorum TaxID=2840884 RepID=A0A9D1J359_9FIRM|nr:spore coat protein [Candidatus Onthousia excrementipullorum]
MNNNQICNPKVETPKGMALNDKDYISSLLSTLKQLVKNYAVSLTEASNETLYSEYKEMFDTYSSLQREVYELMFRKGWYVLEKSDANKISNKYQTLNQEFMDLNG